MDPEAIRTLWEDLEKERNDGKPLPPPKLIYVTAIKNHHIRLAPAQGTQGDRSGNVFAGTATMKEFAQPNSRDFFLVSHKGLLGSESSQSDFIFSLTPPLLQASRPTHYNILFNEDSDISLYDLMSFSNGLCYDFARATCAVSQVTPVYCELSPTFDNKPSCR
jgi:eukaryotic translation initiation factor 2C